MVFVPSTHTFFTDFAKRRGKKWGRIIKSQSLTLNDMLANHKHDVIERIQDEIPGWFPSAVKPETPKSGTVSPPKGIRSSPNSQKDAALNISFGEMGSPSNSVTKSPGSGMPPMGRFSITSPEKLMGRE
jgi:hypothetical protein